jgi:hypothetical protein
MIRMDTLSDYLAPFVQEWHLFLVSGVRGAFEGVTEWKQLSSRTRNGSHRDLIALHARWRKVQTAVWSGVWDWGYAGEVCK